MNRMTHYPFGAGSRLRRGRELGLGFSARIRRAACQAFTLFELLVVMSIMLLIAAIAIPNIGNLGSTAKYAQAAGGIVDTLHIARQTAIVNNEVIEVRFYEMDPELGEEPLYTAIGVVRPGSEDGQRPPEAVGNLLLLPEAMVMDPAFSNLIDTTVMAADTDTGELWNQTDEKEYTYFEYMQDGTADLDPADLEGDQRVYHVTVRELKDLKKKNPENLENFATIRLDVHSGRAKIYRPGVGGGA